MPARMRSLLGWGALREYYQTLANHGVLFLDELSEFQRPSLEALRQPLEDGCVTIVRGQRALVLPTRFMLVAATNPSPRGRHRIRRVARTLADLDDRERVGVDDVLTALALRQRGGGEERIAA